MMAAAAPRRTPKPGPAKHGPRLPLQSPARPRAKPAPKPIIAPKAAWRPRPPERNRSTLTTFSLFAVTVPSVIFSASRSWNGPVTDLPCVRERRILSPLLNCERDCQLDTSCAEDGAVSEKTKSPPRVDAPQLLTDTNKQRMSRHFGTHRCRRGFPFLASS